MASPVTLDDFKLSCELHGHSNDVRSVSPATGENIISGSRDKTAKIWKKNGDGEYIEGVTLKDHSNFVSCVYYLEAEGLICTGSNDATICIYKEDGYVPACVLKGHDSTVCSISKGVERMSIVSGSWDKTARIWTIDESGISCAVVLKGHEGAVWSAISLPNKQFVTGSADKTIVYWNADGDRLKVLKGHTDCVRGLASLGDGSLVSCANDAVIRYWNEDGECVRELCGHSNYIYSLAQNLALGRGIIVSGGEDSSLRMWNVDSGELGSPIIHPTQSVWSVACLKNGDIVTGSSDGVVRVFTRDSDRFASEAVRNAFSEAVKVRVEKMNEELGGMKKTDLPGENSLLVDGTQDGQTKMVRHQDGSVKCYSWENGKWNLVGDVTGATGASPTSKKQFEGKSYDYVFSVDIADDAPPLNLPYNRGEDPWQVAQTFIHKHNLPQAYLDQVANFIVKNAKSDVPSELQPSVSGYQDPFTGGSRYVPGSAASNTSAGGNVDPFTGASSYSTAASSRVEVNFTQGKHFPVTTYLTFDKCDPQKVLEKLREFNQKQAEGTSVSDNLLETVVRLAADVSEIDKTAIEALRHLLRWPSDVLFPVLDITRLAIRNEQLFNFLNSFQLLEIIMPNLNTSAANQLMIIRCLVNMMNHASGRQQVESCLKPTIEIVKEIKSGSANLQIAIATFYLNATMSQKQQAAVNNDSCHLITEGLIELLLWSTDLEACYRSIQAIGNLTSTAYGPLASAQIISVDVIMDKIRGLAEHPHAAGFEKLTAAAKALLAAF